MVEHDLEKIVDDVAELIDYENKFYRQYMKQLIGRSSKIKKKDYLKQFKKVEKERMNLNTNKVIKNSVDRLCDEHRYREIKNRWSEVKFYKRVHNTNDIDLLAVYPKFNSYIYLHADSFKEMDEFVNVYKKTKISRKRNNGSLLLGYALFVGSQMLAPIFPPAAPIGLVMLYSSLGVGIADSVVSAKKTKQFMEKFRGKYHTGGEAIKRAFKRKVV